MLGNPGGGWPGGTEIGRGRGWGKGYLQLPPSQLNCEQLICLHRMHRQTERFSFSSCFLVFYVFSFSTVSWGFFSSCFMNLTFSFVMSILVQLFLEYSIINFWFVFFSYFFKNNLFYSFFIYILFYLFLWFLFLCPCMCTFLAISCLSFSGCFACILFQPFYLNSFITVSCLFFFRSFILKILL